MRRVLRAAASIAIAGLTVTLGQTIAAAQKLSTSDLAAKLSGTWMLNRELSTGFRAPAPGRRGGGGAALFAVAGMTGQRGGRGGGGAGAPLTPPISRRSSAPSRPPCVSCSRSAKRSSSPPLPRR